MIKKIEMMVENESMIQDFKNKLVFDRHQTYQQQILNELGDPMLNYFKPYNSDNNQLRNDVSVWDYYRHRRFHCWCYNTDVKYIKSNMINYQQRYKKNNKEVVWLNVKQSTLRKRWHGGCMYQVNYQNIFNITGVFSRHTYDTYVMYYPKMDYELKLNNIPMVYVKEQYKNRGRNKVITFQFDLITYANMIDFMLKCYRYKYMLFRFLPIEIIKTILVFTSRC